MWNFRLERHDARGDQLPPVPVEMRGYSFSGSISVGDEVTVQGQWREGTLAVEELYNLTTSAQVRAKSYRTLRTAAMIIVGIVFLGIVVAILSAVITQCSAPWPPEP